MAADGCSIDVISRISTILSPAIHGPWDDRNSKPYAKKAHPKNPYEQQERTLDVPWYAPEHQKGGSAFRCLSKYPSLGRRILTHNSPSFVKWDADQCGHQSNLEPSSEKPTFTGCNYYLQPINKSFPSYCTWEILTLSWVWKSCTPKSYR